MKHKKTLDVFANWLENWAVIKILACIGHCAIIVGVIFYFTEADDRKKTKHYQAWQVINTAKGSFCNGGRIDALQDLANDNVSLAGVDLSNAYLTHMHLRKGASLYEANLTGASIFQANLAGVYFADANCAGVFFGETNLRGANLKGANLAEAVFAWSDLRNANLKEIKNWRRMKSIESSNIYGVKNPPNGFVEWAKEHGAVNIKDDHKWRDHIKEHEKNILTRMESSSR